MTDGGMVPSCQPCGPVLATGCPAVQQRPRRVPRHACRPPAGLFARHTAQAALALAPPDADGARAGAVDRDPTPTVAGRGLYPGTRRVWLGVSFFAGRWRYCRFQLVSTATRQTRVIECGGEDGGCAQICFTSRA